MSRKRGIDLLALFALWETSSLYAIEEKKLPEIPDEYLSVGGHAIGLANNGVASLGGISAARVNPGLLSLEPQYGLSGTYQWVREGRDFYQLGVVDSTTSKELAAAILYTDFSSKHQGIDAYKDYPDSPIKKRALGSIAHTFEYFSLGLGLHYIEGFNADSSLTKGVGIGFGIAALISPTLRVGVSVENINNEKIGTWLPKVSRAGIAYLGLDGDLSLALEYRERARIKGFETELPLLGLDASASQTKELSADPERMAFLGATIRIYDLLRLLGAYGRAFNQDGRQSLAGGIGIVHEGFSISFGVLKPYLASKGIQSALNASLIVPLKS